MRKRLLFEDKDSPSATDGAWFDMDDLAEVELTSEDASHPIEAALLPGRRGGWRAATRGRQTIRLLFAQPQHVRRICLRFDEALVQRTQEYTLRWSADGGQSFREIVRQQWNFDPHGSTCENEEHRVDLSGVDSLELIITPDIGNENALASLAELRIA